MLASTQPIASAFYVHFGQHGAVTRHAHERGVCRPWIYRQAATLVETIDAAPQRIRRLQQQLEQAQQTIADLRCQPTRAVVLTDDKQAPWAIVGQAEGVSLTTVRSLLSVLIPEREVLSVPTLGRRSQEAGAKSGALLEVLDECTRPQVRQAAGDEIYVPAAVLMVVDQESRCWMSGRRERGSDRRGLGPSVSSTAQPGTADTGWRQGLAERGGDRERPAARAGASVPRGSGRSRARLAWRWRGFAARGKARSASVGRRGRSRETPGRGTPAGAFAGGAEPARAGGVEACAGGLGHLGVP